MFDWVADMVETTGYWGIALLALLENIFPPIPSELIMPLAGFKSAQGVLSLPLAIAAGIAGSVGGALFWYAVGRRLGQSGVQRFAQRHGRWLTMTPEDLHQAEGWFARHGHMAVLLGRLIPAIRSAISFPAGIARMPLPAFLALSALGTGAWTSLLMLAGYWLEGQYDRVAAYLNPVSNIIVGVLLAWYLWRVLRFKPDTAAPAD